MNETERLIQAGMCPDCAESTVSWYSSRCDGDGLEAFILAAEAGYEFCKTQPEP